jgi:hypothetical protein
LPVTVTFVTSDGNPASALSVTSGLSTLPAGWTATSATSCNTVSSGTPCQVSLLYQPTAAGASGSIVLGFSYRDDSGTAKTGTVTIDYTST